MNKKYHKVQEIIGSNYILQIEYGEIYYKAQMV